jgi:hypothetical protein
MRNLQNALINAGYEIVENESLISQVINCFYDMVDGGIFSNLDLQEAKEEVENGGITLSQICNKLNNI